jgi:hypothetical protein
MQTVEYRTLGYKLPFEAPSTVDEFNANAWKAPTGEGNPCLTEAINNIIYRGSLAEFRFVFLHGREEKKDDKGVVIETAIQGVEDQTGIKRLTEEVKGKDGKVRMKDNEPVTKFTESEEKYFDRVIATLVNDKKFASEETARQSFEPFAQSVAKEIHFDAAARERTFSGPKKLAAKYKLTAARILAAGTVAKANANYLINIGKEFVPTDDKTTLFKGTYEVLDPTTKKPTGQTAQVEVSDKDAEALGWLLKEYQDWKAAQEQLAMADA